MATSAILKSKAFWSFATVSGTIGSFVGYDRYHANLARQEFLKEATKYGQQPLYPHQTPSRVALFLLASDTILHKATRESFRKFAVELLTAAGIDYTWAVDVDGEEARLKWDNLARDSNQPELMFEESSQGIPLKDLKTHILTPLIYTFFNRRTALYEAEEQPLWPQLRSAFHGFIAPETKTFIALDPFSHEALTSTLQELKVAEDSNDLVSPISTPTSFLSRLFGSSNQKSQPLLPPKSLESIAVHKVPCELPQGAFQRLGRFLFGQAELTRMIGESVMKIIREEEQIK
jgi:hypothetical protein